MKRFSLVCGVLAAIGWSTSPAAAQWGCGRGYGGYASYGYRSYYPSYGYSYGYPSYGYASYAYPSYGYASYGYANYGYPSYGYVGYAPRSFYPNVPYRSFYGGPSVGFYGGGFY